MRDFFKSTKFKIIVAVIAVLIGFMIYSLTTGGYAIMGVSIFDAITEPFQKASTTISAKVSETIDTFANAKKYREENEQLRERLNQLYNEIIDYDKIRMLIRHDKNGKRIGKNHQTSQVGCHIPRYGDDCLRRNIRRK